MHRMRCAHVNGRLVYRTATTTKMGKRRAKMKWGVLASQFIASTVKMVGKCEHNKIIEYRLSGCCRWWWWWWWLRVVQHRVHVFGFTWNGAVVFLVWLLFLLLSGTIQLASSYFKFSNKAQLGGNAFSCSVFTKLLIHERVRDHVSGINGSVFLVILSEAREREIIVAFNIDENKSQKKQAAEYVIAKIIITISLHIMAEETGDGRSAGESRQLKRDCCWAAEE